MPMHNLAKKFISQATNDISESRLVGGVALALAASLFLLRALMLAVELGQSSMLGGFQMLVKSSWQDLGLVFLLTSVFLGINLLVKSKRAKRRAVVAFGIVCLIVLLWGLANVEIVHLLGEPFTLDWLYYSDYLVSKDAISYTLYSLNFDLILRSILLAGAFCLSSVFFAAVLKRGFYRLHPNLLVVILAAISGFYLCLEDGSIVAPRAKTLNPVVAFSNSIIFQKSLLLNNSLNNNFAEDQIPAEQKMALKKFPDTIRNVIFFVLESTPAEYIQNYNGIYPVTPNMLKYKDRSMRFDNIYVHAPATNFSLVSLLTSLYPKLASRSITQLHPDIPMITIANILAEQGRQTAFFSSSDTRFQNTDKFLSKKGFDKVEDYRNWECKSGVYKHSSEKWKYMDYSSDLCTINSLTGWIDKNPAKPFFSMIWTGMTHYPYTTEGEVKNYAKDESLNRYLNALRVGDEAFGNLMQYLEAKNLADSTLVVVLGDHGQAFGQHGTYIHASGIFEENVHIPLIFINPKLFSGETSTEVGGISDIAPTVLNILNLTPPDSWQGISLFSKQRANRVFFFT